MGCQSDPALTTAIGTVCWPPRGPGTCTDTTRLDSGEPEFCAKKRSVGLSRLTHTGSLVADPLSPRLSARESLSPATLKDSLPCTTCAGPSSDQACVCRSKPPFGSSP